MSLAALTLQLANFLYPLPGLPDKPSKELKVICVGLPRSGTESLHHALQILGYNGVAHGFPWWADHANSSKRLYKLAVLRRRNEPSPEALRQQYLDPVMSTFEATTDVPGAWHREDLIKAYPNAKVILNRRKDVKAWKDSFRGSVLPIMTSWKYWFYSWFNAELFWNMALTYEMHTRQLFNSNFEDNAETAYTEHYDRIKKVLNEQGRPYLEWSVEDGWPPLCEFLNKPIPQGEFPKGNVAAEFGPKALAIDAVRFEKGRRYVLLVGAVLSVFTAVLIAFSNLDEKTYYNHFHDVHHIPIGDSNVNACKCSRCHEYTLNTGPYRQFRREAEEYAPVYEAQSAADRAFRESQAPQPADATNPGTVQGQWPRMTGQAAMQDGNTDPSLVGDPDGDSEISSRPASLSPDPGTTARPSLKRSRAPEPSTNQMATPRSGNAGGSSEFTFTTPITPQSFANPTRMPRDGAAIAPYSNFFHTNPEPVPDQTRMPPNDGDPSNYTLNARPEGNIPGASSELMPPPTRPSELQQIPRLFAQRPEPCADCKRAKRRCTHNR